MESPRVSASSPTVSPLLRGWRYRALVLSVAASAFGYLLFMLWSGWRDTFHAVMQIGIAGICIVLLMSLLNFGLRFLRWQLYLEQMGHRVPLFPSLNIYLAGFTLATTPGRAGEALRALLLIPRGVPYRHGIAAFISERLSDLMAMVAVGLIGLMVYPKAGSLIAIGTATLITLYMMIGSRRFLDFLSNRPENGGLISLYFRHIGELGLLCRRCHAPKALVMAAGLSVLAWIAEAWAFHLILEWLGIAMRLELAAFIFTVAMLAGHLSFMPGGLGGTEAVMLGLLIWSGGDRPEAVAAVVVFRLATLWFAVLTGVVALAMHRNRPSTR